MSEAPKIANVTPPGLRVADLKMPPTFQTTATEHVFTGDYLLVTEKGAERFRFNGSNLDDFNGFAAQNAEAGAELLYYNRES